ncbi:MAG: argininosuccinate synthase [Thermoplasmatota archaeon]
MVQHILLAYSGGLDTSVAIHWLKQHHHAKVTCALIDVGQPLPGIEDAKERARQNGAEAIHIVDAKQAFVEDYLAPAIQANALYEGAYPLATALARPLIAKELVHLAAQVGADAIAHGCTGKGNDQVRIECGIHALAPNLTVLAPQRSHPMTRDEVLRYADQHNLALPPAKNSPYSIDENLWGRSAEGHDIEDPASIVPEAAYAWTQAPQAAPETPGTVAIQFQGGIPVALDGVALPLEALIAKLNEFAGHHGVGRIDHVENRLVGIKTREAYEAPAATAILVAKAALENLTLTRDEAHLKPQLEQTFANLVYDGKWFHPVMQPVQAFISAVQQHVTGIVTLQLYKGQAMAIRSTSKQALFDEALATYKDGDAFHHQAAEGFIELWGLPQVVANKTRAKAQLDLEASW